MFAVIHPETAARNNKALLQCGFEDTVVNHLLLLKELDCGKKHNHKMARKIDNGKLSRRAFTVQVMHNMECLILNFTDLDIIKKDFKTHMQKFIRQNIQQTLNIVTQLIHMIQNFDKPKSRVMDFAIMQKDKGMKVELRNAILIKTFLINNKNEEIQELDWNESD